MNLQETLGDKLKDLRDGKRITQGEAADLIGISKSALVSYENDKKEPGMNALKSLARFYGVSSDYLLGLEDGKTHEIEDIRMKTGLSAGAVETLLKQYTLHQEHIPYHAWGCALETLSFLIQTSDREFLHVLHRYLFSYYDIFVRDDLVIPEDFDHSDRSYLPFDAVTLLSGTRDTEPLTVYAHELNGMHWEKVTRALIQLREIAER